LFTASSGVFYTAGAAPAMSMTPQSHTKIQYRGYLGIVFGTSGLIDTIGTKIGDFKVEYLRKFEAICKKVSGAQVGLIDEKN
jgi:hypothetical protein